MGTTVSLSSSPEPPDNDRDKVERAMRTLDQQPLRMAAMLRLSRAINECSAREKIQLLNAGVVDKIVGMIVDRSSTIVECRKSSASAAAADSSPSSRGRRHRRQSVGKPSSTTNAFVTQITTGGRRKSNNSGRVATTDHDRSRRGVGYGFGSTRSRWDVERTLEDLAVREEQLVWLLNAVTSYVYCASPDFGDPDDTYRRQSTRDRPQITTRFVDVIKTSTIVPMFDYHIKNESLFDVSERMEFYQALMETVCSMALCPQLADLLVFRDSATDRRYYYYPSNNSLEDNSPLDNDNNNDYADNDRNCVYVRPVGDLVSNFVRVLNAYVRAANIRVGGSPDFRLVDFLQKAEKWCRLISLSADNAVARHAAILSTVDGREAIKIERRVSASDRREKATENAGDRSAPGDRYVDALKSMQINSWKFIGDFGKLSVPFSYRKEAKSLNPFSPSLKERTRRIARELASLHQALPLNSSNSIFVCVDEGRCDIVKVLITGPDDTPYQNGCFEFDLFFPSSYPFSPPKLTFLTTGGGEVRFNPNLYQDGKICLSILNTWEGRPEEKWNPYCSLLQVLVSIQALIFVKEPYFNEPGFERYMGTEKGAQLSAAYNRQLRHATLHYAVLEQLRHPSDYFEEVIKRHFYLKKEIVEEQAREWLRQARAECVDACGGGGKTDKKSAAAVAAAAADIGGCSTSISVKNVERTTEAVLAELARVTVRFETDPL